MRARRKKITFSIFSGNMITYIENTIESTSNQEFLVF